LHEDVISAVDFQQIHHRGWFRGGTGEH